MKLTEAAKYLADKRVLVTGHTGFKGTWLTLLLEEFRAEVWGLALKAEKDSLYSRLNREGAIPEEFIDIRDQKKLKGFFERCRPELVFHLAAQPLVLESYRDPVATLETNIMGTANVIQKSIDAQTPKVIAVITTDKVYSNENLGKRFIETDALEGKDPYSASKVGAEAVVSAFQSLGKVTKIPKIVSFRAGNVIGGGDFAENRLIPDIIRSIERNSVLEIRNPMHTRPWQHVLDPISGYLRAAVSCIESENFTSLNFGPNEKSLTVTEVVEAAESEYGSELNTRVIVSEIMSMESVLLDLDSSLATKLLNWQPTWTQRESISLTIRWWNMVLSGRSTPIDACRSDIKEFLSKNGF